MKQKRLVTDFTDTTADHMNYLAKEGRATEEDLKAWAESQNKNLVCIQWRVKLLTRPGINDMVFTYPRLYEVKYL